jgi:hypothetical protein
LKAVRFILKAGSRASAFWRWHMLAAAVKLTVVAGENLTVGGHF